MLVIAPTAAPIRTTIPPPPPTPRGTATPAALPRLRARMIKVFGPIYRPKRWEAAIQPWSLLCKQPMLKVPAKMIIPEIRIIIINFASTHPIQICLSINNIPGISIILKLCILQCTLKCTSSSIRTSHAVPPWRRYLPQIIITSESSF